MQRLIDVSPADRALPTCDRCWVWLPLLLSACQTDYPIEPTFCDDWCRATLRAGCDEEPENCVRACELTRSKGPCFEQQEQLLECYERADDTAFLCVDQQFGSGHRVTQEVCRSERDAWFECEQPGIGTCLSTCRLVQQAQLIQLDEREQGAAPSPSDESSDAAAPRCPIIDVPCETLCWNLVQLAGDQFLETVTGTIANGPPDASATSNDNDVVECIASGLEGCSTAAGLTIPTDVPNETLSRLIQSCTNDSD